MQDMGVAVGLTAALFLGMVLMMHLGRRIGRWRLDRYGEAAQTGVGVVDGAVFALLGLLIAFTFSGAASRFDMRRALIVEEANDIGTAWLRLDLLPAAVQPDVRAMFRDYADARLDTFAEPGDAEATLAAVARAGAVQARIWQASVAAVSQPGQPTTAAMLLLPALNQMFDIATTRKMATQNHPPLAVWGMFTLVSLCSALLAGHGMAGRQRPSMLHMLGFPLVVAVTVNLTVDLEHPRLGLIRVDSFDQAMREVRASMD
jgi:hypothetical protein